MSVIGFMDLNLHFYLWPAPNCLEIFVKYLALWGQHVVRQCINIDSILGGQLFTGVIHIDQYEPACSQTAELLEDSFCTVLDEQFSWTAFSKTFRRANFLGKHLSSFLRSEKFGRRHLYSGCFTMSPSSITSLPPSLPSLTKSYSVFQ